MKKKCELLLRIKKKEHCISVGEIDTEEEKKEFFKLRYNVYEKKGYIDKTRYANEVERDHLDKLDSTVYFIAKCNNKIIGGLRLIVDSPLPTEELFIFDKPSEFVKNKNLAEIGRLIVAPLDEENKIYLPRNLVMLLLIKVVSEYSSEHKFYGGYSFIKKSLLLKLNKLKFPLKKIEDYKNNYSLEDVLFKYFNQNDDPVCPIYYISEEVSDFVKNVFNKKLIFKKVRKDYFILRPYFYNNFLINRGIF